MAATGPELLADPSFESGVGGWWSYTATLAQSTDQAHTGSHSLKVNQVGSWPCWNTDHATPPGAYVGSLWIYRTETDADISVTLNDLYQGFNYGDAGSVIVPKALGWQELSLTAEFNSGDMTFGLATAQDVTYYLDDTSLRAWVPDPPPALDAEGASTTSGNVTFVKHALDEIAGIFHVRAPEAAWAVDAPRAGWSVRLSNQAKPADLKDDAP